MTALLSAAQVLFCAAAAAAWGRRWRAAPRLSRDERLLAEVAVFFAVFFTGFVLPGVLAVATGRPLLHPGIAAAVAAAATLAGVRFGSRSAPRAAAPTAGPLRAPLSPPCTWLAVATIAAFALVGVLLCLGFPRGFEPRAYHLPLGVHFFRTHDLSLWDREYMDTFPANASVYYGFLLGFLPERLVSASDLVFLAILVLAVRALGRAAGADRSASLLVACGVASIPMVAFSALETGADVGGMAFVAVALLFAVAAPERGHPAAFLAGAAAGIAFGFKSLHLVSAAVLFVVVLVRCARARFAASAWFVGGFLLLAGPWLVRNGMLLGNPLYPVHLGAPFDWLGWKKAPDIDYLDRAAMQREWVASPAGWLTYPWRETQVAGENFKHSSGLGAFFAATFPPAAIVSVLALFRGRAERARVGPFLAGVAAVGAVWWTLSDRQPRYLMAALVYAAPLAAAAIASTSGRGRRFLETLAAAAAMTMLVVVVTREAADAGGTIRARRFTRSAFYGYPAAVDALGPTAVVVNLIDRPDNYALFGERLAARVVNSRRAFRELGASARGGPPREVALRPEALRALGATHLCASEETTLRTPSGVRLTAVGGSGRPGRRLVLWRLDFLPAAPDPSIR